MKKLLTVFISTAIVLSFAVPSIGQESFRINSSPNVVGSGARALGVGGAFIAIADDATAASWNPAALIILKRPEAAMMLSYENRKRFGDASFADFNYIAISFPFNFLNRNVIVSLNYQRLFDFNSELSRNVKYTTNTFTYETVGLGPNGYPTILKMDSMFADNYDFTNDVTGDIGAIAPAFAVQITPKISLGLTVNFWADGLVNDGYSSEYDQTQTSFHRLDVYFYEDMNLDGVAQESELFDVWQGDPNDRIVTKVTNKSDYDFSGINANVGLLVNVTPHLTIGAVYKTPFTATADFEETRDRVERRWVGGDVLVNRDHGKFTRRYKIDFPAIYGLGAAWRFNDNFTMALDASYTPWGDFTKEEYEATGNRANPTGFGGGEYYRPLLKVSGVNGVAEKYADIDGVFTARLGAEYLFILPKTIIPLRVGFAYDPEPAQGRPDDFYSASAGTGVVLKKRYIFDVAYQYRWSQSATLLTVTDGNGKPLEEVRGDATQHIVLFSTIVHF